MADKHKRLKPGQLYHPQETCSTCEPTKPPIRVYLDHEHGLEILDNHVSCQGLVWKFSVGLLVRHPRYGQKTPYVLRACSSHANYHVHEWSPLRPFSRDGKVTSLRVLDSLQDADKAYGESQQLVQVHGIEKWWSEWHPI
ncbi:hypothetical protein [Rothia sp. L_38]|uniref:hypothetical protein n=1 Tax=Rothia sp. L_38 TaxID=3422315 RepID=UPI003D6BC65F